MRLSVATIVALVLVTPLFAEPVPECSRLGTWGDRAVTRAFAIDGRFVYAADGRGLAVYDIANPAAIRRAGFAATTQPSSAVAVRGNRVALLTRGTLELFAIDDAGAVSHLDSAQLEATDLAFADARLITAGGEIVVWGVAGDRLERRATTILSDPATSVAVSGDRVFAGSLRQGVSAYRIDPAGTLTRYATVPATVHDLVADGDIIYAALGDNGLSVIDVSGSSPETIRRFAAPDLSLRAIARSGSQLFGINGRMKVAVFDISDPAAAQRSATIDAPAEALAADGQHVVLAGDGVEVNGKRVGSGSVLRLFDPATRTETGSLESFAGRVSGVATDGRYAYVADPPLLRVIDLADPLTPREVARLSYFDASDLARLSGTRLVVWGVGNAHLFDVADPRRPVYIGAYHSLGIWPEGAAFAGEYMLEANRASGFHVLDISIPGRFHQSGGLINDVHGMFKGVVGTEGAAYGYVEAGVKVIEITREGRARLVKVIEATGLADAEVLDTASGKRRLAVLDNDRLRIFDLTDPIAPQEVGSVLTMRAFDIAGDGDIVWLVSAGGRIMRVDATNPAAPRVTHDYDGLAFPGQIDAENGIVTIGDGTRLAVLRDFVAGSVATPEIRTSRSGSRSVEVTWNGTPGAVYDVAIAGDPAFANASITPTVAPSTWIRYADETRWVRVRARSGCATSAWSNVVEIRDAATGDVVFGTSAQTAVVRRGTNDSVTVRIENRGAAVRTVSVTSSLSAITSGSAISIPAGATSDVVVEIDAAQIPASTVALLTLRDASGDVLPSSMQLRVIVVEPQPVARASGSSRLIIPGVGSTAGSVGTKWKSDLQLFARASSTATIRYIPFGPGVSAAEIAVPVTEGQIVIIPDIVASLFGATGSNGLLEIDASPADAIDAAAVTYNDARAGRYGERITAIPAPLGGATRATWITGIRNDANARTNIAFVETAGEAATVSLELRNESGTVVATATRALAAWESIQLPANILFADLPAVEKGTLTITAPAAVVAYASRVDQVSGDATITFAAAAPAADVPWSPRPRFRASFDASGSVRGAAGSDWKTAVALANTSHEDADVTLTFFPAADPASAVSRVVRISASGATAVDDIATELFAEMPASLLTLGTLVAESDVPIATWGWLYNTTPQGRFGQSLPARDVSPSRVIAPAVNPEDLTPMPRPMTLFPLEESHRVRTNLGLIEGSGNPSHVRVDFYDAGGALLGSIERVLPAWGSILIPSALREAGAAAASDVRAVVETGNGVAVFASSVDAGSGDAWFIGGRY